MTTNSKPSAAQVLRHIADGIDTGLRAPITVALYTPDTVDGYPNHYVEVRLGDNQVDGMAGWAAWLGLDPAATSHIVEASPGQPAFRSHRISGRWRGWRAEIWCADLSGGAR